MSTKTRDRERNRLRQQRKRERDRVTAAAKAEADARRQEFEAERNERIGETLAPKILRHPIMQGETMLLGPRVEVLNGRATRTSQMGTDSDPIAKLARDSKAVTARHLMAFRRLQQDWADVGAGPNAAAVDYLRTGGGGDGMGGHTAMLAQIEARRQLEGAAAHLGAFWPMVSRVVLDCVPLSVWLDEENIRRSARGDGPMATLNVVAWVGAAGARLCGFYFPPKPEEGVGPVKVLTIGPARASYDMTVDCDE